MEDKFPTLTLMGITNPTQIQSYSLAQVGPSKDVLKIRYKRPAGSLRASSRSYEFERTPRAVEPSSTGGDLTLYEIPPILNKALLELDTLLKDEQSKAELLDHIMAQLIDIERDFTGELEAIRAKLAKIRAMG